MRIVSHGRELLGLTKIVRSSLKHNCTLGVRESVDTFFFPKDGSEEEANRPNCIFPLFFETEDHKFR